MKRVLIALALAGLLALATAAPAFARGGPPPFGAEDPACQRAAVSIPICPQ